MTKFKLFSRFSRYVVVVTLTILALACQTWSEPTPTPTLVIQSAKTGSPLSPVMRDQHRRIFRSVWRTVQQHYLYEDYRGVDWLAVRQEFAPLVDAAQDDAAFWALMQAMIAQLGDEHSSFLTPEEALTEDRAMHGELDYVGIGVFIAVPEDVDYGVILFPLPDSPAAVAGLRPHERILSVAGTPACCDEDGFDNLHLLRGPEGTDVEVVLQSSDTVTRTVRVRRERIQTQVPILSRHLPLGERTIGYVMVPTLWDGTIAERMRSTLVDLAAEDELSGLILDLRVNGGGAFTELYEVLSLFVDGEVGYFYRHGAKRDMLTIKSDPVVGSQDMPLIVLIGPYTESFAEVLSGILQDVGRAQLIGATTAGNVETLHPYDLADGSRLWLAEETFFPLSGTRWEGVGVQPDRVVNDAWEDFTDMNDPYIAEALEVFQGMLEK